MEELWSDELPVLQSNMDTAARYDRFFQLKIDPYSRARLRAPEESEISGKIERYVIDAQHWSRRLLAPDEDWKLLDKLYHHLVVESRSEQVTRVIFHRFHPKPRNEVLHEDDSIMDEDIAEPDVSAIRERFKGRCAPRFGQVFDEETGVERAKAIGVNGTVEVIAKYREELLLVAPPGGGTLGSRAIFGNGDVTALRRSIGPRVTSPHSNHSSERREYDSSEPMAYARGWVEAMGKDNWIDHVDNYREERHGEQTHREEENFEDARSYFSIRSDSSLDESRRSASPPRNREYPIRQRTPPPFRARKPMMGELEIRRANWLNAFTRWGAAATYSSCLWQVPFSIHWNPDVLEYGYLIISEAAEFRLRYQVLTCQSIRFPRHVLEVGMEHGIPFAIAYKRPDTDIFRLDIDDHSRRVTKAQVDIRAKGPRLNPSPSVTAVYEQFCGNLGQIKGLPQAHSLIAKGGGASWIMRAFTGMDLVRSLMQGPSIQVTVHHAGANDSADEDCIDVSWDEVSHGTYEAVFGYIPGATLELDTYLFPTDEMLEEYSDHYYREWNPFCDSTFKRIKKELDDNRGKCRTRKEWKHYFQSSNRGKMKPQKKVDRTFVENGIERMKGALIYRSWNKRRIRDIATDIPAEFRQDFE